MINIYIEFRIKLITDGGVNNGLTMVETAPNSIRWKKKTHFLPEYFETERAIYDIYLIGTYVDLDPDIGLKTLIVKAVYRNDPTVEIYTQIGGFIPRNDIRDIPLHITTEMKELNPPEEWIDNLSPMEGGIRAAENGWIQVANPVHIAEAIIEHNVVHELYEYIKPECRTDLQTIDPTVAINRLTTVCG